MSRIDDLIRELCPDGVPQRPLGELVKNRDNERQPITKGLRNPGPFPYFGANGVQDFVDSYIFDGTFLLVGEDGSVIGPDDAPVLNWTKGKIWVNNHAHVLEEKPGGANLRFLYFFLSTIDVSRFVTGGTQKKINQSNLNKIPIPVPPIEVQREIVSILDKFTQLEAELEAELEARRLQYEEARNNLLNFDQDLSSHPLSGMIRELCPKGVSYMPLSECGSFSRGGSLQKKDLLPSGSPAIHYGQIHTNPVVALGEAPAFVSSHIFENSRRADPGSLIIADTSEDVDGVATATAWMGKSSIALSGHVLVFTHSLNPKYVSYCFKTETFRKQKNKKVKGVKVKDISASDLGGILIPTPPLEIQREIVSILDKLDALVNDITFGLPAEIATRRKQYEYYRNKLLTFKELDAA